MNAAPTTQLVIGPNASLKPVQAAAFVGWTALVSFAIGSFFAIRGFWPVLVFATLEIAALAAALYASLRSGRYREVVHFEPGSIRVEFGEIGHGAQASLQLPRSPTRVLLERGPFRNSPTRLLLCCFGHSVELGRCLTDDQRRQLAARMRELIHPGWGSMTTAAGPPAVFWSG
ncbi:MAG: DUF2244 domain-containing protein [Gammaproteobacteria bacterium]|nr:DUF2244 domain-containing protein [Gammaproteobacteria bacterium]